MPELWHHVVLPAVRYFDEVKGEQTCKIGDYCIKIGGVKLGKESSGKHVNTQIVFFADRDKIVLHLYNTTQLILINGLGYKKFINLFFKPFFESKIGGCLEDIELFNDEVAEALGPKTVKRSDIKLRRGPSYPCQTCDFTAKSVASLRKHKKAEHILGNSSLKLLEPRNSTTNNSVIETLMIEDMSVAEIEDTIEEDSLKFTCKDCKYTTKSKTHIDSHVRSEHTNDDDQEVEFICAVCKFKFNEAEGYNSHVLIHDGNPQLDLQALQNLVFCKILDVETENMNEFDKRCKHCNFVTKTDAILTAHIDDNHISGTCENSELTTNEKIIFIEHVEDNHKSKDITQDDISPGLLANLIDEFVKLKRDMKDIMEQMIDDHENGMKLLQKETKMHNDMTTNALKGLQMKVESLLEEASSQKPSIISPTVSSSSNTSKVPLPTISPTKVTKSQNVEIKQKQKKNGTEYQRRPKILMVGDSVLHNTNFRVVEKATHSTIKTSKAYSSSCDKDAKFKDKNVTDVARNELEKTPCDYLVLGAPTIDITNLNTSDLKPEEPTEPFKKKVEKSCQNMIKAAEDAIVSHPDLKMVTILSHAPRHDTPKTDPIGLKPKLADYANSFLLELWFDSPHKNKIHIGSHNIKSTTLSAVTERYRDERNNSFDGVHMYGSAGKQVFTESVVNILLSTMSSPITSKITETISEDFHTRCPQAKYLKQRRTYNSVVAGRSPLTTQNRFAPLGN